MDQKALAKGSSHPRNRNKRIERAPAKADETPEVGELVRPAARRRGRPALAAEEGKRYPIGIRTTKALREKLLSTSRASGRSLAQEIEFRLERSFLEEDVVAILEARFDEFKTRLAETLSQAQARDEERLRSFQRRLMEDWPSFTEPKK
jgi:hypothetical protein